MCIATCKAALTVQPKVLCKHKRETITLMIINTEVYKSNGRNWEDVNLTESIKSIWPIPEGCNDIHIANC